MIHLEVQVSRDKDFARRMYDCHYRIWDRFQEPVACIGVIADRSKRWRPDRWEQDVLGCQLRFSYPIVKLQDFWTRRVKLEASDNPFATVILAHLLAQLSAKDSEARFRFKLEVLRLLYEKQWTVADVRRLFRFMDWVMDLPPELELQFKDRLHKLELEKQMPYITSIERLAKEEGESIGEARGEARGEVKGQIKLLQEFLGLAVMTDTELDAMSDDDRESLLAQLLQKFAKR